MTVPREEVIRKVRKWVRLGGEDMRVAEHTMTLSENCPYNLVAYHAQQCAEKHLKAYLVLCEIDFPYTHNIARLLELCSERPAWGERLRDAEELTPYAITTRYPGEDELVTESEAQRTIHIAGQVRDAVCEALNDEGVFP